MKSLFLITKRPKKSRIMLELTKNLRLNSQRKTRKLRRPTNLARKLIRPLLMLNLN